MTYRFKTFQKAHHVPPSEGAVRLALPRFAAAKPSGRREPPKLRRVQVDDAFDILAQHLGPGHDNSRASNRTTTVTDIFKLLRYAETDDSKIGVLPLPLLLL